MRLFYSPGSAALAAHIALEEAGADYTLELVDFSQEQQRSPDYLDVNPKGRVPALVTERGILTENPAILFYIAQTHPEASLAPEDPFDLARMQALNAYLCGTVHVNHAHARRGSRWADDAKAHAAMAAKVPETMRASMGLIEAETLIGPWVMGDQYTVADAYLYTISRWIERDGVQLESVPRITAHMGAMEARPAVQRVLEYH